MSAFQYPRAYENFWMAFEVSATKLRVFRFAFFALFALDAWLQIAHAPRYGANDFNVTHFPIFEFLFPAPTRNMMIVVFGLQAYLGVRVALGGVSRALYIAVAATFAFGYYISQLNSLQHHYLLSIALCLIAAFPWPDLKPGSAQEEPLSPKEARLARAQNWPVRMLLVSLSVMYFYAAISKLNPLWLDGTALELEISAEWMRDICEGVGWNTMAVLTIATELALMVLIQVRRMWPLAIPLALGMHMSFEFSGLDIGLFSYFMVAVYLLLLPEPWLEKLSRGAAPLVEQASSLLRRANSKRLSASLGWAVAVGLGTLVAGHMPLPIHTLTILLSLCAGCALVDFLIVRRGASAAIGHLAATLSFLLFLHSTNTIRDYYRYWGGQERRSGNLSTAIIAYEDLVRYEPSYAPGRRRLGDLYRSARRNDEALQEYEAGLAIEPGDFALNKAAAQLYHEFGKGEKALSSAKRALQAQGGDQTARRIRDHWMKKLGSGAKGT